MEGVVWLVIIGIAIWLLSNSGNSNNRSSNSSSSTIDLGQSKRATVQTSVPSVRQYPRTPNIINEGFQPDDRCSCGGTWVKRENRETGGRFFSCSRYPTCKNLRDQVLKARLGAKYSEIYCSNGHHKPTAGVIFDAQRGKDVCKRCVDKGYLVLRSRGVSGQHDLESAVPRSAVTGNKTSSGSRSSLEKCRNGHPRTSENTYVRPDGSRECRVCKRNSR